MTEEDLKAMKLHEEIKLDDYLWVKRVPNGWIYYFSGEPPAVVFVPEVLPIKEQTLPRLP